MSDTLPKNWYHMGLLRKYNRRGEIVHGHVIVQFTKCQDCLSPDLWRYYGVVAMSRRTICSAAGRDSILTWIRNFESADFEITKITYLWS